MNSRILKVVVLVIVLMAAGAIGYAVIQRQGQEAARKRLAALGYVVPTHLLRRQTELDLSGLAVEDSDLAELTYLDGLERLNLSQTRVTDRGIASLSSFKLLTSLNLDRTGVTSASLKAIGGLTRLESLSLKHTQISDAGIQELGRIRNLRELHVSHTRLTDRALEGLRAHRKTLQELNLIETLVTDKGLRALAGFDRLQTLYLKDTQVTDAGLEHLIGLKDLRRLGIGNTRITDVGLATLARTKALETLYLDHTGISDRGLRALGSLQTLTLVNLADTKTTPSGTAALRRKLPRVGIVVASPVVGFPALAAAPRPTRTRGRTTRKQAEIPRTYVPRINVSFSAADYPPAARAAGIGWVSVGVRLRIAPGGAIEDVTVLHVHSSKEGPTPHEQEFSAAARRLFLRATILNPPGGKSAVSSDTRVVFKLN